MELTYDWRGFQELFYPHRRGGAVADSTPVGPVYLVVDRGVVVTAFADNEDLSDWVGASYDDIAGQNRHRALHAFDRGQFAKLLALLHVGCGGGDGGDDQGYNRQPEQQPL